MPNPNQVSISSTLSVQIFLYERCFGSFYYINVTREKLPKQRLYKKFICLTLMKLTPALQVVDGTMLRILTIY